MIKPINFETAKLLKEKGFREPVVKCYSTYKENIVIHSVYSSEFPEDMNGTRHEIIPNVYPNPPYYSAPTIAQVIMWLYEKHGIWIQGPFPYNNSKWGWVIFLLKEPLEGTDGYKNVMSLHHEPYKFNSPTEAYEKAIEYVLSNLI